MNIDMFSHLYSKGVAKCMIGVTQRQRAMDWNGTCLILSRSNGNAMVDLHIVVSRIVIKAPKIVIYYYLYIYRS